MTTRYYACSLLKHSISFMGTFVGRGIFVGFPYLIIMKKALISKCSNEESNLFDKKGFKSLKVKLLLTENLTHCLRAIS